MSTQLITVVEVFSAFIRAARDLTQREILLHALWPPLVSLAAWSGIAVTFWEPARVALAAMLPNWSWLTASWMADWLINAILLMTLAPLVYLTALLLVATVALPLMMSLIAARDYPDLSRHGSNVAWGSFTNTLLTGAVFLLGWLFTLPLLLIPGVLLVMPLAWAAWLNQSAFRFDALADHATAEERRRVIGRGKPQLLLAGVGTALLAYVPLINLLAPAWTALVFVHLCLGGLRRLRAEEGVWVD